MITAAYSSTRKNRLRVQPESKREMYFRAIAVSLLWLCPSVSVLAQHNQAQFPWFVTAQVLAARFHADLGYEAGEGVAVAVGRSLVGTRLAVVFGFSHARTTKSLELIDGEHETGAAAYQVFVATRAALQPTKVLPVEVFVDLQTGWLHLSPRAFRFTAGALGEITLQSPHENKFAPAWGAGLRWRLSSRFSALAEVKQHFVRGAIAELERNSTRPAWRPFYQWGAGFSAAF